MDMIRVPSTLQTKKNLTRKHVLMSFIELNDSRTKNQTTNHHIPINKQQTSAVKILTLKQNLINDI